MSNELSKRCDNCNHPYRVPSNRVPHFTVDCRRVVRDAHICDRCLELTVTFARKFRDALIDSGVILTLEGRRVRMELRPTLRMTSHEKEKFAHEALNPRRFVWAPRGTNDTLERAYN